MKVCIIGNSLTALTLASALIKQNINVDMFCKKKKLFLSKTSTIGISKSNIDYFNENVININRLLWNIKKIEIFSDNLKKEKLIDFENKKNQVFSIVKNYQLYELLWKGLNRNKYFKLKFIISESLSFTDKYDIVINCDHLNNITKKYFTKKILKKYNSNAYTSIITHEKILNNVAVQIFTKEGPLAFLPISNTQTSVVYSIPNSVNETKQNIEQLIKIKNMKYKIKNIEKINSFELKFLNLRSYYHNNILAFGDLLHRIHPLAGQGFNMTIRDIKILLKIIKKRIEVGLPLDKSVNIEFENKVRHKNLIFSNGVDFIYKFFNFERKINKKFLSKSVQLIGNYPKIKKIFTKIADNGAIF